MPDLFANTKLWLSWPQFFSPSDEELSQDYDLPSEPAFKLNGAWTPLPRCAASSERNLDEPTDSRSAHDCFV